MLDFYKTDGDDDDEAKTSAADQPGGQVIR